jgi:TonB family protein
MINIHTMEDEELMSSFSQRHKILAAALATVFIGSGHANEKCVNAKHVNAKHVNAKHANTKAEVEVDESEPVPTFSQAYKEYTSSIKSGKYSANELERVAKLTYQLGRAKFGPRHQNTFMLQQNLANAYLEAGEYKLSATNYESVIDYYEETQGDESQAYYFALLDIINVIYSANKAKKLSAQALGISQFSGQRAIVKLFKVTDELIVKMPENSLMFRGHTVKTAVINKWAERDNRLLNMAKKYNLDANKNAGKYSSIYIESLAYVGKVYFGMKKYKDARCVFEQVLTSLQAQNSDAHPLGMIAHAHLVSLYARKKETKNAIFHTQAIAKIKPWDPKQLALYQVPPTFPPANITHANEASVTLTCDISLQGQPINIRVTDSTDSEFNAFAIKNIKQWYFVPKFVNGAFAVATDLDVMIDFLRE